jgi:hypothetical protein
MQKALWLFMFSAIVLMLAPSCNSNKIACPTYAESFPESTKKKSKKPEAPKALPKKTKLVVSHSMKPGGN